MLLYSPSKKKLEIFLCIPCRTCTCSWPNPTAWSTWTCPGRTAPWTRFVPIVLSYSHHPPVSVWSHLCNGTQAKNQKRGSVLNMNNSPCKKSYLSWLAVFLRAPLCIMPLVMVRAIRRHYNAAVYSRLWIIQTIHCMKSIQQPLFCVLVHVFLSLQSDDIVCVVLLPCLKDDRAVLWESSLSVTAPAGCCWDGSSARFNVNILCKTHIYTLYFLCVCLPLENVEFCEKPWLNGRSGFIVYICCFVSAAAEGRTHGRDVQGWHGQT